jgi:hypothetical protein
MEASPLQYDLWVEQALRDVVRRALTYVAKRGLPGDHHLYLTVKARAPGVEMPAALRSQYPEEITIVLQNQFWDLSVQKEFFEVTLSFGGVRSKLHVPYCALTAFADPAINFGLQMKPFAPTPALDSSKGVTVVGSSLQGILPAASQSPERDLAADNGSGDGTTGEIVALDAFRKK